MELAFHGPQRQRTEGAYGIARKVELFLRPCVDARLRHRHHLKQAAEARCGAGSRAWACRSNLPRVRRHSPAGPDFSRTLFVSYPKFHTRALLGRVVSQLVRTTRSSVCSRIPQFGLSPAGSGPVSGPRIAPNRLVDRVRRNSHLQHRQQVLSAFEPAVAVDTADDENATLPRSIPWTLIGTLHRPRF